ncbi:MAG TPA: aldose epimerase, partial [Candidatus Dormibacteraeota bacterium]
EDERAIPTGRLLPVAGTDHDFTTQRPIGDARLDTCFTELERGPDGLAWVDLETPEHDRRVSLWLNRDHPYLMLFTGDSLAPDERRRSLGVEPMTAAPNAFQNGLGLRLIDPGETVTTEWGISPRE